MTIMSLQTVPANYRIVSTHPLPGKTEKSYGKHGDKRIATTVVVSV